MNRQRTLLNGLILSGLWAMIFVGCGGEELMPPPCHTSQCGEVVPPVEQEHRQGQVDLQHTVLTSVVSSITLPTSGADFGLDLNGDHVIDNQIGQFLGLLRSMFGVDLQGVLNEQLTAGKAILIYEVLTDSLSESSEAEILAHLGMDLDDDPTDNYSGRETFAVKSQRLGDPVLRGQISAGRLTTQPGPGLVAIPFRSQSTVLSLRRAHIQAQISAEGLHHGILAGALPMADLINNLLPVLSIEITRIYQWPELPALYGQLMTKYLDLDGDGTITVKELKDSEIFGLMLQTADVDTDYDGTPDAVSFGVAFDSVPCGIHLDS